MNLKEQLAVQSYCYRNFKDNAQVIELVKEAGLSAIELCGVHVDFNDESTFDDVISLYRDSGIAIVSIGVEGITDDEAAAAKRFKFAKKAECQIISVNFQTDTVPAAYRVAEKLSDEYDINCAIHNHGGRHWLGSAQMLSQVFSETSSRIGLNLDTAWALHSHENPVAMAEKFINRLYGLHLKDFTFDSAGEPEDVIAGTGNLDLPALIQLLKDNNFSGPAIIEYEGDVENPGPAIKGCVESILKHA